MDENSKDDEDIKRLATNSTFRTMNIIEVMSVNNNLTLEELAPKVNLSKPTLFRFLSTLREMGYVTKNINNRYSLTYKVFAVASASLPETELSRISQPFMEDISYRTGETSIMGVLDGNSVLYLNKIESKYNIKFYERIGKRIPLYCTAPGIVLMADFTEEELERFFKVEKLVAYTEKTLIEEVKIRKRISYFKQSGIVVTESEYEDGHKAMATPIYNSEKKIIASLYLTWPLFRDTSEKMQIIYDYLTKASHRISTLMGYSGKF